MSGASNKRLYASVVAIIGTELFSSFYDDLLYPLAIIYFGPITGGGVVSVLALVINFLLIIWYRKTDTDWYAFELTRSENSSALSSGFRRSRAWNFVLLALVDPFLAFAYYEGRKSRIAFDKRDWFVFLMANILGIGSWLFLLVVVYASGGLISENFAHMVMYGLMAYGLIRILLGVRRAHGRTTAK